MVAGEATSGRGIGRHHMAVGGGDEHRVGQVLPHDGSPLLRGEFERSRHHDLFGPGPAELRPGQVLLNPGVRRPIQVGWRSPTTARATSRTTMSWRKAIRAR